MSLQQLFSIASIIISCFSFLQPARVFAEQQKIRVAVITSLSGEGATWGEALRNGLTLGLEKLPPDVRERLELIYEDDQMQPKTAVSALQKLLSSGPLDAVINSSSGTAKAIAPIAEARRLTMLAIASDPQVCAGRKYVFNFWVTPEVENEALFPEISKRGYKKIARISSMHDGALAVNKSFDSVNNGRLEILVDEQYTMDTKDFRTFISKVRAKKNIDAIMPVLLPGQLGIFAKQAREHGLKQDLFGWETFEDSNEVRVSEGALVGAWYVNASDGTGEFLKLYRERFPKSSIYVASNGHDAALLLGSAVEKGFNKENFYQYLATLKDFSGVLGVYSASGDQRFTMPAALKVVTREGFKNLYQ